MKNTFTNKLLLALPKPYGFSRQFENIFINLTAGLSEYEVSLIPDDRGISTSLLDRLNIKTNVIRDTKNKVEVKSIIKNHTHFIIFWDGYELTEFVYELKILKPPHRIIPVEITRVCNKDRHEPFDVYIGRGSPWGNPFPIEHITDGATREEVIEKYATYMRKEFLSTPEKLKGLLSLKGMRLGCHCKPLACHGDVIADFLNTYEPEAEK